MWAILVWTLLVAGDAPAKLPAETAKEMPLAIIAVNKALGLESWVVPGEAPCIDRGGLEGTIKDVSAADTRTCAGAALAHGFSDLGKRYTVGVLMADIGPSTVFAIGYGDAEGWGAYSCDPSRKCPPTKLSGASKQAKRLAERYRRACGDARTLWFPNRDGICEGIAAAAPASDSSASAPTGKPAPKPATEPSLTKTPWPVKE